MEIKLKLIAPMPVGQQGMETIEKMLASRRRAASPETVIDFVIPREGPSSLSNMSELNHSAEAVLPEVIKAPEEGYSAVIVDCTCDQLYPETAKKLSIPLVPALHSTLYLAAMLDRRFSIITPTPGQEKIYSRLVDLYGFNNKKVSVQERIVDFISGESGDDHILSILLEEGHSAVNKGAQCIVLGCTALTIEKILEEKLGVTVLAPGNVAVKTAEMLVKLGLNYS